MGEMHPRLSFHVMFPTGTRRNNNVNMRHRDVVWRHDDVIFASCVRWVRKLPWFYGSTLDRRPQGPAISSPAWSVHLCRGRVFPSIHNLREPSTLLNHIWYQRGPQTNISFNSPFSVFQSHQALRWSANVRSQLMISRTAVYLVSLERWDPRLGGLVSVVVEVALFALHWWKRLAYRVCNYYEIYWN